MTNEVGYDAFFAAGYGGQYLYIIPELDSIIVTTADYQVPPEDTLDRYLITDLVFPSIQAGGMRYS